MNSAFRVAVGVVLVFGADAVVMVRAEDDVAAVVAKLAADLRQESPTTVWEAAERLKKLGPAAADATDALIHCLSRSEPHIRYAAAEALGAIGSRASAAIPALIERLGDEGRVDDQLVAFAASTALGKMGEPALAPLMAQLDASPTRLHYFAVCSALHDLGMTARPALDKLREGVLKNDERTIAALYGLAGLGAAGADAIPAILKALESEDFHTQYWACRTLGAFGPAAKPAVGKLIEQLKNGVTSVRRNAAIALGDIGPVIGDEGIAALVDAMTDPLQPVREQAVIALGKLGAAAKEVAPTIKTALRSNSIAARSRAAGALYRIDPAEAEFVMEVLLRELQSPNAPWDAAAELAVVAPATQRVEEVAKLLDSDDEEIRIYTADALGAMGKAAAPYVPRLKNLAENPQESDEVREAAREAMVAIEAAPATPRVP